MSSIVVAFPKPELAANLKKILAQSGYRVAAVVHSGSAALAQMNQLDHSILICATRFQDMMYTEINEYLTNDNKMLVIGSVEGLADKPKDMMSLSTPLKVFELVETVRIMDESLYRLRKKQKKQPKVRSKEDEELLFQAKHLLMTRNSMSEEDAHRYIQKRSMDNGTGLVETAQMILALNDK